MLLDAPWPYTVVAYALCLFLYSMVWVFKSNAQRCVLELHTGFFLIVLGYDSWTYLVVYMLYTIADLFVLIPAVRQAAASGLLYFYAHSLCVLALGPAPFLASLPAVLLIGRVYRLQPDRSSEYVVYNIRAQPDFIRFLI